MPNGPHKHPPVGFRPPEADRAWLLAYARETGQPVGSVLREALAAYRAQMEGKHRLGPPTATVGP